MPDGISVSFTAIRTNRRGRRAGLQTQAYLNLYTETFLTELMNWVKQYPPEISDSKYIRTGKLGEAWRLVNKSQAPGVRWELSNRRTDKFGRAYAPLVHGSASDASRQVGFHSAHRWRNIKDGIDHTWNRRRFALGAQAVISRNVDYMRNFF